MTISFIALVNAAAADPGTRRIELDPSEIVGAEVAWSEGGELTLRITGPMRIRKTAMGPAVTLKLRPSHPLYGPSVTVLMDDRFSDGGGADDGGGPDPDPVEPEPVPVGTAVIG